MSEPEKMAAELAEDLSDEEVSVLEDLSVSKIAKRLQERWSMMSREKRKYIALRAVRKERSRRRG